jgi:lipoyl(octanoyl) transferase
LKFKMTTGAIPANSVWFLLRHRQNAADSNMALDEALLQLAPELGGPVLRFYGWLEPAATFGYSQRYADMEKLTRLRPLVRRPTGGGLVPHDTDWTYSLVFPAGHFWHGLKAVESYRRVHEWIRDAFAKINVATALSPTSQKEIPGQCFIGAEKDDVLWQGRKIAGAAQRRTRNGLLIQGSVQPPPIGLARDKWESAMCDIARTSFSVEWQIMPRIHKIEELTDELRLSKYSQPNYNQNR